MSNQSNNVYKDGDKFYFDPEIYTENALRDSSMEYEDGDMIKWTYEGKRMTGTLRQVGYRLDLFLIEDVAVHS